jgi:hypothetical protein
MSTAIASELPQWTPRPEATRVITDRLELLCQKSEWLLGLRDRLLVQTGTKLIDWVDTIHVAPGDALAALGFSASDPYGAVNRWHHPAAQLPWVVADGKYEVVLRVESVADFLRAQSILQSPDGTGVATYGVTAPVEITGPIHATRRSAIASEMGGVTVSVLQRHGDARTSDAAIDVHTYDAVAMQHHEEQLRLRNRQFEDGVEGIQHTIRLARAAVADLGVDLACDLFFRTEREYWQLRNDAAELQYRAQSLLGFGWANHDHHTYRSSRSCFAPLVELLEVLGMGCRERFYAGADAGWGAQVLEQPRARIVVFADVDMSADEVLGDFAHEGLSESESRGTVGLWCHLHGEAVLQAGMHHLECQFDFEAARQRLEKAGASSLNPFTDFEYLRQAFTRGQMWPVAESRIASALKQGWINDQQADRFRLTGATGSHLEVLERNDGYKGFNQTGISDIIARTDPRNADMH